jgi:hypothetical protein
VAVLGSSEFDVMQIDPATVKLAEATNFMPIPGYYDFDGDAGASPMRFLASQRKKPA